MLGGALRTTASGNDVTEIAYLLLNVISACLREQMMWLTLQQAAWDTFEVFGTQMLPSTLQGIVVEVSIIRSMSRTCTNAY